MITNLESLFDPRSHVGNDAIAYTNTIVLDVIIASGKVRPITRDDSYTKGANVIELVYSGNPPTMSFKMFVGWVCDIGAVGDKYAIIDFKTPLTNGETACDCFPRRVFHPYRVFIFDGDLNQFLTDFVAANQLMEQEDEED